MGYLIHHLFFQAGIKVPIVLFSWTLVHFFNTFFFFSFFHEQLLHSNMHLSATKLWRDNNKKFGAFIGGYPIGYIFRCLLSV
jgi:hypothetical protein